MKFQILRCLFPLALTLFCVLAAFGRLVSYPGGMIVDTQQAAVDTSIPVSKRTPGNDLTRLFLPHHLCISQALHETGRIPTWDARGFGGRPLVGNPQAGLWYPPVWIFWVWPQPGLFGWLTVAHLISGAAGVIAIGHRLKLGSWALAIAGVSFALNPYLIAQVIAGHLPQVWAACWTPWIILSVLIWKRGNKQGALAFGPLVALCMLTGHPQVPYLVMIGLALWFAMDWLTTEKRKRSKNPSLTRRAMRRGLFKARSWLLLATLLALPLALTAVEWLPDMLAEPWSLARARQQTAETDRYAVGLANLWQLIDPLALGGPADYRGIGNYAETQIGPGGPVIILALLAWVLSPHGHRRLIAWLMLAVVICWWLAAGRALGLLSVLGWIVPGLSRFRVPGRALFLAAPLVGLLAGLGVHVLMQRGRTARTIGLALGMLTLAHLTIAAWLILKVTHSDLFLEPNEAARLLQAHRPDEPFRVRAVDALFPDLQAVVLAVEKTNVEDWFQIQHAADLYETLYPMFDRPRPVEWFNPLNSWVLAQMRQGALDRLNVSRLLCREPPRGLDLPVLAKGEDSLLLDNPTALPRAYVVPRAIIANHHENPALRMAWINPREAVLMDSDPLDSQPGPRQPFISANLQRPAPDHFRINAKTTAPGLLVIAESWMPGWAARLNGQPVPVLRGNHAQMVVSLPSPGAHIIELTYHPPGLWAGAAISIVGIFICLLFARHTVQMKPRTEQVSARAGEPGVHAPSASC